jgi:O-antigen ligase
MEAIISLIIWAGLAYWCYKIAEKNGRSTGLAIFMGLLFGLFAVIVYALMGKTPMLKAKELDDVVTRLVEEKRKK